LAGCVLRIEGKGLTCPKIMTAAATSAHGFVVDVGDAEGDEFPAQVGQAIAFLERHSETIRDLSSQPGFKAAELDFGVWNKAPDGPMQSHSFPPLLLSLASRCGLALTLTVYDASDS